MAEENLQDDVLKDEELEGKETKTDKTGGQEGGKTFTQADLDSIVEARLARERKKLNKELEDRVDKEAENKLKEKQRIASLSDEERKLEGLTQREKELAELENKLNYRERFSDTESALRERDLKPTFAKFLIADDEESTFGNIKEFQEAWDEAIAEGVKEALKGKTPKVNVNAQQAVDKDTFETMGYLEKLELKRKDEALYNKLKGLK